jgi:hypothetical protein
LLTVLQERQQHRPTNWKFQRIVMARWTVLIDLPEVCGPCMGNVRRPPPHAHAPNFIYEGKLRARK